MSGKSESRSFVPLPENTALNSSRSSFSLVINPLTHPEFIPVSFTEI